jgi:hypothetical protein
MKITVFWDVRPRGGDRDLVVFQPLCSGQKNKPFWKDQDEKGYRRRKIGHVSERQSMRRVGQREGWD